MDKTNENGLCEYLFLLWIVGSATVLFMTMIGQLSAAVGWETPPTLDFLTNWTKYELRFFSSHKHLIYIFFYKNYFGQFKKIKKRVC